MTKTQLLHLLDLYDHAVEPYMAQQMDITQPLPRIYNSETWYANTSTILNHARWMIQEMKSRADADAASVNSDKTQRWLGWIQAALVFTAHFTVAETGGHIRDTKDL